jgi:hypothetical protein
MVMSELVVYLVYLAWILFDFVIVTVFSWIKIIIIAKIKDLRRLWRKPALWFAVL